MFSTYLHETNFGAGAIAAAAAAAAVHRQACMYQSD